MNERQIDLKGILEGSEEQLLRHVELGWSEDDGIPNPEELMKQVRTQSSNTNYIAMVVVTRITSLRLPSACCS